MKPARVIMADPAWLFDDKISKRTRGASNHYRCLTVEEIAGFAVPISTPVAHDCLLALWRVAAMQREALHVAASWGFTVKSEVVWVKTAKRGRGLRIGMGRYVRNCHEVCLICTRGRVSVADHSVPSVIFAPRGKHSEKPDEIYRVLERLVPGGPYLELFARRRREGWIQLGDQLPPLARTG